MPLPKSHTARALEEPPLARWLRRELAPRLLAAVRGSTLRGSGFFDMARLARLAERHLAGAENHATALWAVLVFDAFLRHDPSPPAVEAPDWARAEA